MKRVAVVCEEPLLPPCIPPDTGAVNTNARRTHTHREKTWEELLVNYNGGSKSHPDDSSICKRQACSKTQTASPG
ncbi:hypothetical protein FJTKL_06932 [Diaporthe vaccinii]|uniref:Uncharacterized protein n=1 Tax=Diaporthe vaccinii TaxID=105482 RepID=A0ABR4EW01_9PEZI